jgi:RNA polymerase sigma-32 factor
MSNVTTVDTFNLFCREIRKYPILTQEKEIEYATKYHTEGCLDSAIMLVNSNLRFVIGVAYKFCKSNYTHLMDLIQEGTIGLMNAIKRFDPSKGIRLITYAKHYVNVKMREFLLHNKCIIKLGSDKYSREIFNSNDPSKYDEHPSEHVRMLNCMMRGDVSIYSPINDEGSKLMVDIIEDDQMTIEDRIINLEVEEEFKTKILNTISSLNEREQYIIENRITADKPMTRKELSKVFEISEQRIAEIEYNLIKKLKNKLMDIVPHKVKGEEVNGAVLNEEKVKIIKKLLTNKVSQAKIAKQMEVSKGCIQRIAQGTSWAHVTI